MTVPKQGYKVKIKMQEKLEGISRENY